MIVSCSDGSVKIYFCKKNAKNEIILTLLHELWKETDQVLASNLKVVKQGNRSILVFSKENVLLIFALQNNQIGSYRHEFDKNIAGVYNFTRICLNEFFFLMNSCNYFIIFSGLEILDDSCIFVILTDHQTYNLSVKDEKCVCVPIPFKTNSCFKSYAVRGVSFSRKKVFCVISLG